MPLATMFDQIRLSYFCGRSSNDNFCQIIFNSDLWFQRNREDFLKFSHGYIMETGLAPGSHAFLTDRIYFSYFCRGSP